MTRVPTDHSRTTLPRQRSGRNAVLWFLVYFSAGSWLVTLGPYGELTEILGTTPFEVSGYDGDDFRLATKQYIDDVRAAYVQAQLWDLLIHGILMTVAATKIALWIAHQVFRSRSVWRNLGYGTLVLGITDGLENLLILAVLVLPEPPLWLANFASATTSVKLWLVPTLLLLPLGVVSIWVWQYARKSTH